MRKVLRPRWLAGHVAVLVIVYAFLRLGLWQWHRAGSKTGGIQNLAYALEWPVFAGLALWFWGRSIRDEIWPERRKANPHVVEGVSTPVTDATEVESARPTAEGDPELAEWNARFAALHARDAATRAPLVDDSQESPR